MPLPGRNLRARWVERYSGMTEEGADKGRWWQICRDLPLLVAVISHRIIYVMSVPATTATTFLKIGRRVDVLCTGRESENTWQWWQARLIRTFRELSAQKILCPPSPRLG